MTYLLAGVLLGIAGSVHCAAMCGPLLLAINPISLSSRRQVCRRMFAYHAGRLAMYALLGAIAGYAGEGLIAAGLGRAIAVLAGALLIVAATGRTVKTRVNLVARLSSRVVLGLSSRAALLARWHQWLGYALLGLANGLFPCGLLYAAVVTAAAGGTIIHSVLFMIGFGAGTLPALLALTVSATTIPAGVRRRFRVAFPAVMALAGILLIARGVLPIARDPGRPHSSILSHHH